MDPSLPLSRRSILRLIPAAAVAATAVVLSAKEALAKEPTQQAVAPETPTTTGHRAIIGML
ncbi:hypothetical protein ACFUOZ_09235 [Paenarthrobacter sp. NPDC057355]|uniref:hypothetical protein n=1 Tax=Paenarthrobacter sp. NPDC057355 TaxID=3346105 RepID=UPI003644B9A6